ncbi:MAG: tetratricopeptide repeat protein [Candidatus Acidiferrales bacterium]
MAQHISRRELKKDEVRETFAHGAEALLSHQQLTLYLLIAAVVVAVGIFGWREYAERQTVKAFAAFDDARKVFQAPVGAPAAPGEVAYPDASKKFAEAQQKFSDVASKYPRTRAGELARYYAGLSFEKLDKNAEAKESLQKVANSSGDEEVAAMARFELAGLEDRMGQGDEAAKLYQQLIAKPTVLVPKPIVMLALAEHYREKSPAEAAKLYEQIKADYPDTPIAEQADQALALLPGKS